MKTPRSRLSIPQALALLAILCLVAFALWAAFLHTQTTVVHTARNTDGHVLTITFQRRGMNPMGSVIGQISSGGRIVSEMLLVDDETSPIPPRVEIVRVAWIKDSDLLGRCVIDTQSKHQSQRFVIAYMNMIPGEFAHFPATAYLDPVKDSRAP